MSSNLTLPEPTWFVGCGNMGRGVIEGWRMGGLDLSPVTIIRPSGGAVEGARVVTSPRDGGPPPRLVVLAFKPQKLDEIAPLLRQYLSARTIVVSLLAGVETASLRQRFPGAAAIVRAMPNLPVAVRRGVTGLYSDDADGEARTVLNNLFSALGYAIWMADEGKLAALGSVAGAGPAYVARFVSALARAGVRRGLTEQIATTIALETVLGTAWMASMHRENMDSIAARVASPRGTTEAGLAVLDHDHVLDELIALTIEAAARRGAELAEDARTASLEEGAQLS
ncbi:MAG TPA: pyrroline-5-carboxylate reductase [Sphingomicrobium sp.]|nr:pyrroline-5-carboxylate reductase [Sphingomicrobium sp.]